MCQEVEGQGTGKFPGARHGSVSGQRCSQEQEGTERSSAEEGMGGDGVRVAVKTLGSCLLLRLGLWFGPRNVCGVGLGERDKHLAVPSLLLHRGAPCIQLAVCVLRKATGSYGGEGEAEVCTQRLLSGSAGASEGLVDSGCPVWALGWVGRFKSRSVVEGRAQGSRRCP